MRISLTEFLRDIFSQIAFIGSQVHLEELFLAPHQQMIQVIHTSEGLLI